MRMLCIFSFFWLFLFVFSLSFLLFFACMQRIMQNKGGAKQVIWRAKEGYCV